MGNFASKSGPVRLAMRKSAAAMKKSAAARKSGVIPDNRDIVCELSHSFSLFSFFFFKIEIFLFLKISAKRNSIFTFFRDSKSEFSFYDVSFF